MVYLAYVSRVLNRFLVANLLDSGGEEEGEDEGSKRGEQKEKKIVRHARIFYLFVL